jgi:predicted DNA-binding transcriptional regulator AlpA
MPRLLNINQLTVLLELDRATVYRWVARGYLPQPQKKGGASLWNLEECINQLTANRRRVSIRVSFAVLQLATESQPTSI